MSHAVKVERQCYQSDQAYAPCKTCGKRSSPVHMPDRVEGSPSGFWFCADCCPVCKPKPEPTGKVG
jgi:hypothetical protein